MKKLMHSKREVTAKGDGFHLARPTRYMNRKLMVPAPAGPFKKTLKVPQK